MKNKFLIFVASAFLATVVALVPAAALAQSNNANVNANAGRNNGDSAERAGCLRAFGHLIAPGWNDRRAEVVVKLEQYCNLPPGIARQLGKIFTDPEPDTTAPVISEIKINPGTDRVTVTWTTDERSDTRAYLSLKSPLVRDDEDTQTIYRRTQTRKHEVIFKDLEEDTTYYLVLESRDVSGNITISRQQEFHTQSENKPEPVDTTAPVISEVASVASATTIKVTWLTNEPATSRLYYSTNGTVASLLDMKYVGDTTLRTSHDLSVTGLASNTRHYLVLESKDENGNTRLSGVFSVVTTRDNGMMIINAEANLIKLPGVLAQ